MPRACRKLEFKTFSDSQTIPRLVGGTASGTGSMPASGSTGQNLSTTTMKFPHCLPDFHEAYFWTTHQRAEIDLVLFKRGQWVGVECKRMAAPALTPSVRALTLQSTLNNMIETTRHQFA